ncbi:unnamed protein product [Brassica rapa subsp. narinosa]
MDVRAYREQNGLLTKFERRIDAIKAIRDIEIEQSLTAQRLLCSTFSEEQLETPVLDFFKENLPDVSIEVEDNGEIEFKWNHNTGDSSLGGYPLKWILYCSAFQTLVFYGICIHDCILVLYSC